VASPFILLTSYFILHHSHFPLHASANVHRPLRTGRPLRRVYAGLCQSPSRGHPAAPRSPLDGPSFYTRARHRLSSGAATANLETAVTLTGPNGDKLQSDQPGPLCVGSTPSLHVYISDPISQGPGSGSESLEQASTLLTFNMTNSSTCNFLTFNMISLVKTQAVKNELSSACLS
jgi:hypothetical protein